MKFAPGMRVIIRDEEWIRNNYSPCCSINEYMDRSPDTPWGMKYLSTYRIIYRLMVGSDAERTLTPAILPPKMGHIDTIFGISFEDLNQMLCFAGACASIPYDYYVRAMKKRHIRYDNMASIPLLPKNEFEDAIIIRVLLLNCLTSNYSGLWEKAWKPEYTNQKWSCPSPRVSNDRFSTLTEYWHWGVPLRSDYERRKALVELDVLVAKVIGMTLRC